MKKKKCIGKLLLNIVSVHKVVFCHPPACLPAVLLEGLGDPEVVEKTGLPDLPIGVEGRQVGQ